MDYEYNAYETVQIFDNLVHCISQVKNLKSINIEIKTRKNGFEYIRREAIKKLMILKHFPRQV